jgi:SWI/SNF-related matrix-associated actin-dependent regulator 1 of chromatin subfamily A
VAGGVAVSLLTSATATKNLRKGVLIFNEGEFTLTFDQNFIASSFHEYQVFLELIKKLKQKSYDGRRLAWNIPVSDEAVKCLNQLISWGITPTREARERLSQELKQQAQANAQSQAAAEVVVELSIPGNRQLTEALKNYQKAGVKFMAEKLRAYNGDEMGLGKSLQCLATFEYLAAYPALIICPVKLKQNWLAECRKWLPNRKASMLAKDLADITILSYSEIHNYVNVGMGSAKAKERKKALELIGTRSYFFPDIMQPVAVACDEGHFIKTATSRRTMAATAIAQQCKSKVRLVLSGTPIENAPKEMIAPIMFLGVMDRFGGWYNFAKRYCGGVSLKGATNTREFYEQLCEVCYIRRKKKDVLKELPDKIESVYEAEISNSAEYRRIEKDVLAYLMDQRGGMLSQSTINAAHLLKLNALRQAVGRGKVEWIVEWVDTFLESGEKFVLYAYHREVLSGLVAGLKHWNPATVLGGCPDVKAEQDKFMNNDDCRLFIGSTVAAGFGLTLTRASNIGIAELMWTHSKHLQVIDRCHRIGQKDCVNAYYFLAPGTIDDDMWQIVSEKAKIVTSTTDGEEVTQSAVLTNLVRKFLTRTET